MANEKKLIDANALIEKLQEAVTHKGMGAAIAGVLIRYIKKLPTVDVVEVKHGRWQPHYEIFDSDPAVGILGGNYQTGWQCSVCGRYESIQEPYCNCGAKMDGDQK